MPKDGDSCPAGNEEINEQIRQHESSAAGVICQLKTYHGTQASHLTLLKDVVGVVATLGTIVDDNLSRYVLFTLIVCLIFNLLLLFGTVFN